MEVIEHQRSGPTKVITGRGVGSVTPIRVTLSPLTLFEFNHWFYDQIKIDELVPLHFSSYIWKTEEGRDWIENNFEKFSQLNELYSEYPKEAELTTVVFTKEGVTAYVPTAAGGVYSSDFIEAVKEWIRTFNNQLATSEMEFCATLDKSQEKGAPWGFWWTLICAALCYVVVILIGPLIVVEVFAFFGDSISSVDEAIFDDPRVVIVWGFVAAPLYIFSTLICVILRKPYPGIVGYFSLRKTSLADFGRWTLIGAIVLSVSAYIQMQFIPDNNWVPQKGSGSLLFLSSVLIILPFAKEWLFRGFMFRGLEQSAVGPFGAVIITSVAWAAAHISLNWYSNIDLLIVGLLFGFARWKTQSLWIPIWLHFLYNLITVSVNLGG